MHNCTCYYLALKRSIAKVWSKVITFGKILKHANNKFSYSRPVKGLFILNGLIHFAEMWSDDPLALIYGIYYVPLSELEALNWHNGTCIFQVAYDKL